MKNKYLPLALSIYSNYILIGICVIIINLNRDILMAQWNTDDAGLGWAVGGMGIGKLIVMIFGGALSDKLGRKPFVAIGQLGFVVFYLGILMSTSAGMAFAFAVLCGMANSFIDSSGMPAVMECFPNNYGFAVIMIKGFVSFGQALMPMIINYLAKSEMWFGIAFVGCAIFMAVNLLFMLTRKFPPHKEAEGDNNGTAAAVVQADKARMFPEGVCLSIIGFTSTASFTILLLRYAQFGEQAAGMAAADARLLVSKFAIGSICAVFATAFMLGKKWVKSIHIVFAYPLIATVVMLLLYLNPSPAFCVTAAYILGFTAGGGVLQLAVAAMAELFTFGKGKVTSIVYTLNNISIFVVPVIIGYLAKYNVANVILFDVFVTGTGALLAGIVLYRYRKIYPSAKTAAVNAA